MAQATDDVYYLYVGTGWSGPFRVDQIRLFVKEKQIAPDTYAFEPQQQMQLTVAQLLSHPAEAATGSYQSATAPPQTARTPSPQDDDRTQTVPLLQEHAEVMAAEGKPTAAAEAKTARERPPIDEDVIDLDKVATIAGTRVVKEDSDVIDLDAMARAADAPSRPTSASNRLTIEIDEPRGRPAESTLHGKTSSSQALEVVLGELENLRKAYNALMEDSIKDREEAQRRVHVAHLAINEVLEERKSDVAEIRSLVAEIDQVATDLAHKHHDSTLSTRIVRLRDSLQAADVSEMVQFAEAVLRRIVEQYDRQVGRGSGDGDPFSTFEETGAPVAAQLAQAQEEARQLRDRLAREQEQARDRLLNATTLLESERAMRAQDQAELRTLITEIYRLACDIDPQWLSRELYGRVQELWRLLAVPDGGTAPTAMAPVADQVLTGLVHTLAERARHAPASSNDVVQEIGTQRRLAAERAHELSTVRAELLQTRTDLSLLRQREQAVEEEKARLTKLLDEQRQLAEKAQQAAKAREQRLRSTVTALEVTKELHQEVMNDLQTQLAAAQAKVESMELELRDVRGQLTARRERREGGDDLQAEMRRVVEMRAMLDARKEELSADLRSTEAELQRVSDAPDADRELADALATKVTHLRQTYEQTLARLNDQEAKAQELTRALEESRREAGLLRTRSDDLNHELHEARSNLSAARKRVEELHLAHQRLEAERESLQRELSTRRGLTGTFTAEHADGTASVTPAEPAAGSGEADLDQQLRDQEKLRSNLENELARERRRVEDLASQAHALSSRITELQLDRDHLKQEHDRLVDAHAADQQRLNTALATATQSAIEAEARQRQAEARIAALEAELASAGGKTAAPATAEGGTGRISTVRLERQTAVELSQLRADRERLTRELADARTQHQQAMALLAEAKQAVAQASQQAAAQQTAQAAEARTTLVRRLERTDAALHQAATELTQVKSRLQATQAECERLARERESAAAEHRAALQSARNRLADLQARAEGLEQEVVDLRAQAQALTSESEGLRGALTTAQQECAQAKETLGREQERLHSLTEELARARATCERLSAEQAQEATLAREQAERLPELEGRLERAQAERSQLLAELDRLRSEVVTLTQERSGGRAAEQLRVQLEGTRANESELAAAKATCTRLTEQVAALTAQLATQERAQADLADRLAIATRRAQTAEELLEAARDQQRQTAHALDAAHLERARLEVECQTVTQALARVRTQDAAGDSAAAVRIQTLERHLQAAQTRLHALETEQVARAMAAPTRPTGAPPAPVTSTPVPPGEPVMPVLSPTASAASPRAATAGLERVPDVLIGTAVAAQPEQALDETMQQLRTAAARLGPAPAGGALEPVPAAIPLAGTTAAPVLGTGAGSPTQPVRTRFTAVHGRAPAGGEVAAPSGFSTRFNHGRRPTCSFRPGPNAHAAGGTLAVAQPGSQALTVAAPAQTAATTPTTLGTGHDPQLATGAMTATAPVAAPTAPLPVVVPRTGTATRFDADTTRATYRTVSAKPLRSWPDQVRERWQALSPSLRWLVGLAGVGAIAAAGSGLAAFSLPSTGTAVVNADVQILTSPIEGTVKDCGVTTGGQVHEGQVVAHVHNEWVDEAHLRELTLFQTEAETAVAKAQAAQQEASRTLDGRLDAARTARAAAQEKAHQVQEQSQSALRDAQETLRLQQLVLAALAPFVQLGRLQETDLAPVRAQILQAQTQVDTLAAAAKAANAAEATAAEEDAKAQADVAQARATLEQATADLTQAQGQLATYTHQIEQEQAHLAALRDQVLRAPLTGSVWVQKATAGAQVQSGAPILAIADPATIAVEAVLDGALRDQVHAGDRVRVRISGAGLLVDGHIRSLGAASSPTHDRAQDLGPQPADALRATIDLDTRAAPADLLGQGCEVVVIGDHTLLGSWVGRAFFRLKF